MKKIITILLLQSSFSMIAMDNPAAGQTPEQIAQEARRRIILEGPDAQLHKENSFLWAYMHPEKSKFSEQGLTIPHFKHSCVSYVVPWREAHAQLVTIRAEVDCNLKVIVYDTAYFAQRLITKKGRLYRFTLADKFMIQKIMLYRFETNCEPCVDDAMKANRALYEKAFSCGNWQELSALAAKQLHCEVHPHPPLNEQVEAIKIECVEGAAREKQEIESSAQEVARMQVGLDTARMQLRVQEDRAQAPNEGGLQCAIV